MQLVSEIFNLCGPDPPTAQTDGLTVGQTDDMQLQYRALAYSASRGKKDSKTKRQTSSAYVHCTIINYSEHCTTVVTKCCRRTRVILAL